MELSKGGLGMLLNELSLREVGSLMKIRILSKGYNKVLFVESLVIFIITTSSLTYTGSDQYKNIAMLPSNTHVSRSCMQDDLQVFNNCWH